MSEKEDFIIRLTDQGISLSDAIEEWGIHLRELDAYKEFDLSKKKTKKKKKDTTKKKETKVASLRPSKDKKFIGHTGRG